MMSQLANLLDALATKLGVTVQYLWGVELHQVYSNAISGAIWSVIFAVICVVSIIVSVKCYKEYDDDGDDGFLWLTWIFGIVAAVFMFISLGEATTVAQELANPANYAYQNIIQAVSQK